MRWTVTLIFLACFAVSPLVLAQIVRRPYHRFAEVYTLLLVAAWPLVVTVLVIWCARPR